MQWRIEDLADRVSQLSDADREKLEQRLRGQWADRPRKDEAFPPRAEGPLPLSYAQERLWFLDRLETTGPAYNVPVALRLTGQLDRAALQSALDALVQRHEVLRTSFPLQDGRPVQLISPPGPVAIGQHDFAVLPAEAGEAAMLAIIREVSDAPFDLDAGPLLRAALIRLSAARHVLLVVMHHIICDGWSMAVLVREAASLYRAAHAGEPHGLAPWRVQYADFALWQRRYLDQTVLDRQLGWWRERLAGAPAALTLPTDRPRPMRPSFQGDTVPLALAADLTQLLDRFARETGSTPFMVVLAAFALLLGRHAGQQAVVIGSPVANRTRRELEDLIGFFVNTLALPVDLSGAPSFRTLVARVRDTALGAYANQDLPFEQLIKDLQPVRDLSRQPVFQAMVVMDTEPSQAATLAGLRIEPMAMQLGSAKFDLTLWLGPMSNGVSNGLSGSLEYACDLFERETAVRLGRRFEQLLAAALAQPDRPAHGLPLASEAERRMLLADWNSTAAAYPAQCMHEMFAKQAAGSPDALALVHGPEQISYRELDARASRLAAHLRDQGVGPETVVGLCAERSVAMVVGLLGILKAGGAYLPLDPDYPGERLAFMTADAGSRIVVTHAPCRVHVPSGLRVIDLDQDWSAFAARPPARPSQPAGLNNLAYVIYTSGSTGQPKAVMARHRSVASYLHFLHRRSRLTPEDAVLQVPTFAFDASLRDLLGPLLAGSRVVLPSRDDIRDPWILAGLMQRHGVTALLSITPSRLDSLLAAAEGNLGGRGRVVPPRLVLIAGEPLSWTLCKRIARQWPETVAVNQTGATEATMTSTWFVVPVGDDSTGTVPVGMPIANTRLHVLDREFGLAPPGVPGELHIGGVGLTRGYLNRPGLTADRFVPDPFAEGERLYRTGDLALRRANGMLELLGRIDDQMKLRGFRIEPGEIEAAFAAQPGIRTAAVVAQGEGSGTRLIAYVVPAQGTQVDHDALRSAVRRILPEHMMPSAVIALGVLPLTLNGKLDRAALPDPVWQPTTGYVAPRTPLEKTIAGIWEDLLGLERVGVKDDFFDIGGHSLLATRVVARLREHLDEEVPLRVFLEGPTVEKLAAWIIAELVAAIGEAASEPVRHEPAAP